MIVQNQNTAWVSLALIVLCMAVFFGAILTGVSIGPSQEVKDEQARVGIRATEAALGAMQTPQAVFAAQTAVAAELTALPPIQTATAIAAQQAAIQTKTADDLYLNNVVVGATVTAIAENQRKQIATTNAGIGLAVIVGVAFCVWVLSRAVVNMLEASARRNITQATALDKQRQLAEFRASHQKSPRPIIQPSIPTSLMKERGNGHKKSTAG